MRNIFLKMALKSHSKIQLPLRKARLSVLIMIRGEETSTTSEGTTTTTTITINSRGREILNMIQNTIKNLTRGMTRSMTRSLMGKSNTDSRMAREEPSILKISGMDQKISSIYQEELKQITEQ